MKKKLIYLIIGLVAISALVAGSYYSYYKNSVKDISSSLEFIQESLAETAAIKDIGDLLQAKKKNLTADYTWAKVETMAASLANQIASLSGNYRLAEYKKAATIWTVKIREAAKDPKIWSDVPAQPGDFTIKLRNNEAGQLLKELLSKITELTQFGSDAITRKDKETMRYVAAKLLVQKHWLNGLAHYQEAGYFADLVASAYAATEQTDNCSTTSLQDQPWCILRTNKKIYDIQKKIDDLLNAAMAYSRESKDAEKNWNQATKEFMDMFKEQGVLSPETAPAMAKIMQNNNLLPPDTSTPSSKVQTYQDNCLANGGKLSGVNKGNGWIPTAENGNYCDFKDQEKNCWNFLTYSGSYFAGGDDGCEQHNVLPAATGPNSPSAQTSKPAEPPAPVAKTETPSKPQASAKQPTPATTPKSTTPKTPLRDLGTPTGTAALKIEFTLSQNTFTAQVGERFSYSFCQPAVTRSSDLCTAASTNPRYGLPPYSFYLESGVGFLPYGLTLNLNGLLEGTPTAAGSRTVGICAKDTGGFSVCRKITISVKAAAKPLTISIDSTNCEFVSYTTPWDPNPYWAIYKMTANGSISSTNQQVVSIDIGGKETGPPLISCGSWSANVKENEKVTCTGEGSTSWQYSITINHGGPVPVRYQVVARTEDYSIFKLMPILCAD